MKREGFSVVLLAVLLLSSNSYAFGKGKKDLRIYTKVQLENVVLEPGDYKVEASQNTESAEVSIYKGKDLILKAPAERVKLDKKLKKNSVRYQMNSTDVPKIVELDLAGEMQTYRFNTKGS